jgi:hypothetical protein
LRTACINRYIYLFKQESREIQGFRGLWPTRRNLEWYSSGGWRKGAFKPLRRLFSERLNFHCCLQDWCAAVSDTELFKRDEREKCFLGRFEKKVHHNEVRVTARVRDSLVRNTFQFCCCRCHNCFAFGDNLAVKRYLKLLVDTYILFSPRSRSPACACAWSWARRWRCVASSCPRSTSCCCTPKSMRERRQETRGRHRRETTLLQCCPRLPEEDRYAIDRLRFDWLVVINRCF